MFTVREATPSDKQRILELYKRVTVATPGGIARSFDEITETYIQNFMQEASLHGLEFVIDNPGKANEIIAEIHCYKLGPKVFDHILSELTIVIDPSFQSKGLGKLIFTHLLDFITHNLPDILRVELVVKDSHINAIKLYAKMGFIAEGKFEKRFRNTDSSYDADIPMVWYNPNIPSVAMLEQETKLKRQFSANEKKQSLKYCVLDVFTKENYKGNPLSVVFTEEELELPVYENISREFGYSETSFIYYSKQDKALKVRSFTPTGFEVNGAGHNLLGAICAVLLKNVNIFHEQQGNPFVIMKDKSIDLFIDYDNENGLPDVSMKQQSAVIGAAIAPEIVADAITLCIDDLLTDNFSPTPTIVKTEVAHLMIPLKNVETLNKVIPNKHCLLRWRSNMDFRVPIVLLLQNRIRKILCKPVFSIRAWAWMKMLQQAVQQGRWQGFYITSNFLNPIQNISCYRV